MAKKPQFKLDETGSVFQNVDILQAKLRELGEREAALLSEIRRLDEINQGIGANASPEEVIRFLDSLGGENAKRKKEELWSEVRKIQQEKKVVRRALEKAAWEARQERVRQLKPQVAALAQNVLSALEQARDALKAFEEARFEAGQLARGGSSDFVGFGRLNSRLIDAVIREVKAKVS